MDLSRDVMVVRVDFPSACAMAPMLNCALRPYTYLITYCTVYKGVLHSPDYHGRVLMVSRMSGKGAKRTQQSNNVSTGVARGTRPIPQN